MISDYKFEKKITWKPEELHGKVGKIVLYDPTESDFAEGNYLAQLWFLVIEDDFTSCMYLLQEWDVRKRK